MSQHVLSIDIPITQNVGIMLFDDTSIYTSSLPVSNQNLQITPPGFSTPTIITSTVPHFRLVLNACMLGIANPTACASTCPAIPDGIYGINYSVSPNDKVFVSYQYLRIVSAINRLDDMLCSLSLPCCLPNQELIYELQNIDIIRNYLRSAQTNVNNLHNFTDGINQYRYAISLMDKMINHKPKCYTH